MQLCVFLEDNGLEAMSNLSQSDMFVTRSDIYTTH